MDVRLPVGLRILNWTVIFLTVIWIAYDRVVTPLWQPPLRLSAAPLYAGLLRMAAIALGIGLLHLAFVHVRRVWRAQPQWGYSLALLLACMGVVAFGLSDGQGLRSPAMDWVYAYVLAPGEAALMASTLFVLAGSVLVLLRTRRGTGWLLLGLLPVLFFQMPWIHARMPAAFQPYLDNALHLFLTPVVRGLLLGSGFLILAAVARFLIGSQKSPVPRS